MRNRIIVIVGLLVACSSPAPAAESLPPGVKSGGGYEANLVAVTPQALAYARKRLSAHPHGFRLVLSKGVSDKGLTRVASLRGLKRLELINLSMPVDLSRIRALGNLTHLRFRGCRLKDESALATCASLRELEFEGSELTSLAWAPRLRNLQKLILHQCEKIGDYGPLAACSSLTELSVYGNGKNEAALAPIGRLSGLKTLTVGDNPVKSLRFIAGCINLHKLDCIWARQLEDIAAVNRMTELRELVLWGTAVADIRPLAACRRLSDLNLAQTRVTNLAPLSSLSSIKSLNLEETGIMDLSPLRNLRALRSIDLSETKVTDVRPLARLRSLTSIELPAACKAAVASLKRALPKANIEVDD